MNLEVWTLFSLLLFSIGLYGVLARKNLIGILIGIELMLNAANINFMAFNHFVATDPVVGQVIVLFVIGLAAAETAIALSIILAVYRQRSGIDVTTLEDLRG